MGTGEPLAEEDREVSLSQEAKRLSLVYKEKTVPIGSGEESIPIPRQGSMPRCTPPVGTQVTISLHLI